MEDTIVFIDGHYLSLISKRLGEGKYLRIDYNQFAISIAKSQKLWCFKTFYYVAPPFQSYPPTKNEMERKRNYDKFVSKFRNIPEFIIREGRCQRIGNKYNQKGVDTLFTMDLFDICTNSDDIKTIILLACDTDFVPILKRLREKGIKIILFYYNDYVRKSIFSMSNYLLTECETKILLTKSIFDRSIKK